MENFKYGIIHAHTDNSVRDGAMSPTKLCKKAAELGAPAVVLTDHGVLSGVYEFMRAAKENKIKGIPGVEAYVKEDASVTKPGHMLLIPKDYQGYQAIARAVTKASHRTFRGQPCMNTQILEENFGPKANGHNHVIATSACVSGILARILLQNEELEKEKEKIQKRQGKYSSNTAYVFNKERMDEIQRALGILLQKRDELNKLANRKFAQKERALESVKKNNPDEYESKKEALEKEKHVSQQAAEELEEVKKQITQTRRKETTLRKKMGEDEKSNQKWEEYQKQIVELESQMLSSEILLQKAEEMALSLQDLFGNGNFYIELQYHQVPTERQIMPVLADMARRLSLPVVACNDAHYAEHTANDILPRQILQSLRFERWEERRADSGEYYLKTDAQLKDALSCILGMDMVEKAMEGIGEIIRQCDVQFPKEHHYPQYQSKDGVDAKERLRALAEKGIVWRYPNGEWNESYQKRMEYELGVIEKLGFSDYLCIVEDFLRYGRKLGKDNPEQVGIGIGPGRGSAVGSLVCYLIGITGIDPMRYGLLFERFLNTERVSMPDIDSDFRTDIREKVLDYVKSIYGENAVCGILTKGTSAARASVRAVARAYSYRENGSKEYLDAGDTVAKLIPQKPGILLADVEEEVKSKFKGNRIALEIFDGAKLIEGTVTQFGMHAAGVIIADNGDVGEYVPLAWNEENKTWVCQCTMTEAEADAHLLKMDFLGLRNLNIISEALRYIKRDYGISLDIEEVGRQLKDGRTTSFDRRGNVFDDIFSTGKTTSVFQFESAGMKGMLKKFKPTKIDDIILLVAAYRPGPMQYLDEIIQVKNGKKKPQYIVPALKEILDPTYGKPIYQEQLMQIFHKVAGFTLGEADIIRRAMSKKKVKEFSKYQGKFVEGLVKAGAKKIDAESFWEELLEFSKYAFNKSHAAAYAFVAFYTAWLKLNYPVEYETAALSYASFEKISALVADARDMGVEVLKPDINFSENRFTIKDGKILFGLTSVKGVKGEAEGIIEKRKEKKFISFRDYIQRAHTNKTVTENLIKSGAMDAWCDNRLAMLSSFEQISDLCEKVEKKEDQLRDQKQVLFSKTGLSELPDDLSEFSDKKLQKEINKYNRIQKAYQEYYFQLTHYVLPISITENRDGRLAGEKEVLGLYLTEHPLNDYKKAKELRSCPIAQAEAGEAVLCGFIEQLRITRRKKDGKPMAFFQLSDETGSIEVCFFTKAYEQYGAMLTEDIAVAITGKCMLDEEEESEPKLFAEKIVRLEKEKPGLLIAVKDLADWTENVYPIVMTYAGKDYEVYVYDKMLGEIRQAPSLYVDGMITQSELEVFPLTGTE